MLKESMLKSLGFICLASFAIFSQRASVTTLAQGPGERGPRERGPLAQGPLAQGPQERGPRERGPRERGPRERGPRGRGGPSPMQQMGQQGGVLLLNMKEVRAELGIRDQQQKPLDDILAQLQKEMMEGVDFFGMFQLGESERQKQFEAMRTKGEKLTAQAETKIAKILDDQQSQRLEQLILQQEGIAPFTRPDLSAKLQITEQQQQAIKAIEEKNRPSFGFGPPDFDRLERQRNEALSKTMALLTDEQKAKWSALTGVAFKFPRPQFGFGGRGPGGPMGGKKQALVEKYDVDNTGWLNQAERQAARKSLADQPARGRRGFGAPGQGPGRRGGGRRGPGGRGNREPAKPGPKVSPQEVETYPGYSLFEPTVLRTLFLEFENEDWEAELQAFKNTDVEVPATLTVDGRSYPHVGVHFRGMSSFMMVPAGNKRSLNLSLDFVKKDQRLYGYKTLNLLNCNGDASLMSTALYSNIAREFIPAPKSNFVKVVINGESWGVYANVQQFNKIFLDENYGSSQGTRWKVRGNPGGDGGLRYFGEDLEQYKKHFQMKSNDGEAAWNDLIELCRVLNETPLDQLEEALNPILDIDGALRFLAIDVALMNSDGYWTRASDYTIFREKSAKEKPGLFHVIPHDMNEAFRAAHGPGGFGPSRRNRSRGRDARSRPEENNEHSGNPFDLDPLVNIDSPRFPLRSRLLAVPNLRAKYLEYVRQIAERSLDWKNLGPVVAQYHELIQGEVEADTKKLSSFEAFERATSAEYDKNAPQTRGNSIRQFAEQRQKFLLEYQPPPAPTLPTEATPEE